MGPNVITYDTFLAIAWGMLILCGVKICLFSLTSPVAINTGLALPHSGWFKTLLVVEVAFRYIFCRAARSVDSDHTAISVLACGYYYKVRDNRDVAKLAHFMSTSINSYKKVCNVSRMVIRLPFNSLCREFLNGDSD